MNNNNNNSVPTRYLLRREYVFGSCNTVRYQQQEFKDFCSYGHNSEYSHYNLNARKNGAGSFICEIYVWCK